MSPEIMLKISNDKKLKEYLRNNSYWYKYLNRDNANFNHFYKAYKSNNRTQKLNKATNIVNTLDTVNTILKMFN